MVTADVWAVLEEQPGSVGTVTRRIHPESARNLHVGLDLATRARLFTYRRPWEAGRLLPALPRTQAMDCLGRLEAAGAEALITVVLREPALYDVFTAVVDDLAQEVVAADDDDRALAQIGIRLSHWQDLFEALARDGLGQLERRGLAGELVILRDLLLPNMSATAALTAWTGPLKRNQDFQLPSLAIEVKVTTGMQPQGFVVANERELDETATGVLLLAHLSLDERQGGAGATLVQLVSEVEAALAADAPATRLFRERLARVGYLAAQADLYADPRYEVRHIRYFRVAGDFPRVTEADLRPGVGRVKYEVSLAACGSFAVSDDEASSLITNGE